MKHFFALISFFFIIQTSSAQLFKKEKVTLDANQGRGSTDNKLLRWGYFLGISNYDFNFDYNDDLRDIYVKRSPGFNVGLIGNLRINSFIDLRLEPGLLITTRELHYSQTYFNGVADVKSSDLIREVKSTYIHIPLLIKISTKRINNFKPFVVGGFSTALNLSSNENNPEDNSNGQFRTTKNSLFYELGFGIDFYLHNFKFTPSIRGLFGINDELVRDKDPNSPWTSNIASMKSRGLFINFTFQ
ncbi:Outer membrane protein beta-barrel domain-containing protein [Flaviramulus basaltis]|uniref:Outer membrane protein beta-barrel domain-containing protein n=1 Tax=Flaviramulus basaltis TaxID=369401 RepID=A0A1K2IMV2_9FLAO|nr:porin family protein [Flaviramulus basaltis]SFZ93703.1 Outer membrane protein beta-barrel domain-containing protein [Flaviramulus basaltis]